MKNPYLGSLLVLIMSSTTSMGQFTTQSRATRTGQTVGGRPTTAVRAMPGGSYSSHNSYTDFYKSSLKKYHRPPVNPRDYTINKYFYHRPTLSPYLNLARPQSQNTLNNYHRYVRPELNRRAQTNIPARSPAPPRQRSTNPYFNSFYRGP